ncbi:hypothetical protein KD918_19940, partial [Acinetobacter baumannii]|uniref:hypothetical protein n=1 Tax=Acinetobacter baumannii TaxID=470 RepID=UPI001B9C02E4
MHHIGSYIGFFEDVKLSKNPKKIQHVLRNYKNITKLQKEKLKIKTCKKIQKNRVKFNRTCQSVSFSNYIASATGHRQGHLSMFPQGIRSLFIG